MGEAEVHLSLCPTNNNFPVKVKHQLTQRLHDQLPFGLHSSKEGTNRVPISPKLHLLPSHSTSLMPDGCGGSGVFPLSLGWRRVGVAKELFYYWTTFSPVLCQEGNRIFSELLISRPVSGYGLVAIWNIGVVTRKQGELTPMLFFKSWGPRQPTFFFLSSFNYKGFSGTPVWFQSRHAYPL